MGECADGAEAAALMQARLPQLIFVDVQMQGVRGLAFLEQIPADKRPVVVLVTAHGQYALDAFQADVTDYLLKPFTNERFGMALARAMERIRQQQISLHTDRLLSLLQETRGTAPARREPALGHREKTRPASNGNRLVVKSGSHIVFVDPKEVDWIQAEGVYLRLYAGKK